MHKVSRDVVTSPAGITLRREMIKDFRRQCFIPCAKIIGEQTENRVLWKLRTTDYFPTIFIKFRKFISSFPIISILLHFVLNQQSGSSTSHFLPMNYTS